jgi:hypothetical protein
MTSISAYPHWVTGNARNLEGASGSEVEAFDPESQDGSDTSEAVEPRLTIRPHRLPVVSGGRCIIFGGSWMLVEEVGYASVVRG